MLHPTYKNSNNLLPILPLDSSNAKQPEKVSLPHVKSKSLLYPTMILK